MVRLLIPDSRFPIWPPGQQKITIWVPIPDFLSRQKIPDFSCFLIFVTNQRDWIWSIATMASARHRENSQSRWRNEITIPDSEIGLRLRLLQYPLFFQKS